MDKRVGFWEWFLDASFDVSLLLILVGFIGTIWSEAPFYNKLLATGCVVFVFDLLLGLIMRHGKKNDK